MKQSKVFLGSILPGSACTRESLQVEHEVQVCHGTPWDGSKVVDDMV